MSPRLNEYAGTACSPTNLIPNTTYIKQSQPPVGYYTPHSLDTCQTIPSISLVLLLSKTPIPQNRFLICSHYYCPTILVDNIRIPYTYSILISINLSLDKFLSFSFLHTTHAPSWHPFRWCFWIRTIPAQPWFFQLGVRQFFPPILHWHKPHHHVFFSYSFSATLSQRNLAQRLLTHNPTQNKH